MIPDAELDCIDCGGTCHLLTTWPYDDEPQPGDVMAYVCSACYERFDVVLPEPDD